MTEHDHTPSLDGRDGDDEGFVSRWSRRKQQTIADQPQESAPSEAPLHAPGVEAEPLLTDADMPPLHSLDVDSDYSGFLSSGVSEELRQLALRKLFRAATFNITDGLDDYDDDFTSYAKLGSLVTREMRLRDAIDDAREKAKALLQQQVDAETSSDSSADNELNDTLVAAEEDAPPATKTATAMTQPSGHADQALEESDHE